MFSLFERNTKLPSTAIETYEEAFLPRRCIVQCVAVSWGFIIPHGNSSLKYPQNQPLTYEERSFRITVEVVTRIIGNSYPESCTKRSLLFYVACASCFRFLVRDFFWIACLLGPVQDKF